MNEPVVENLALAELSAAPRGKSLLPRDIDLIRHVQVTLTVQVGSTDIPVERLFALKGGDVLTLQESVEEPVTLCIGEKPVARGLLVAVDDHLGVEITEILAS